MTDDSESDKVCQASATRATDPVTIPAHSFKTNNRELPIIEMNPANLPKEYLISGINFINTVIYFKSTIYITNKILAFPTQNYSAF